MDCGGHRSHQRWRSGRALGCDPRRGHTRAIKEWSANVRPHVRDLCECPIKNRYVALFYKRLNHMRADIVAGAVFPDYDLTDHAGKRRKLSDLQGPDPMVLVLSRGGFCPKDRRQAEGLVQLHHEMEVGYSRLVTISTDSMLLTNEYRDVVGAHWTFLSDPGRKVQKDLDIAEYTDPEHNPMIPHVIVLEPGLFIFKIYNGYWFFFQPTIEELRQRFLQGGKTDRPYSETTTPVLTSGG